MKAKTPALPPHTLVVRSYAEFRALVQAYAAGVHELMAICGAPGIGKTEILAEIMNAARGRGNWKLIKGKHTPLDLYSKLYDSRSLPIVLDDLDALLANHDNTALLKCVCDTKLVKRVEWGSNHKAFTKGSDALPKSFDSISRVCIIANDWGPLNKNVAAIHDRGVSIHFRPDALEIHREVGRGGWFHDDEVFRFIGTHLFLVVHPSFRLYKLAEGHKKSGLNWKDLTLRTIQDSADPGLLLVAKLLADKRYEKMSAPETVRWQDFERFGGGSRASFFRLKKQLMRLRGDFDSETAESVPLQPATAATEVNLRREQREFLESMPRDPSRTRQVEASTIAADAADAVRSLEERLETAIATENYELAARLRDDLRRFLGSEHPR